jgi:hypothetical protein
MQLFLLFTVFLPFVLCDNIKINSPTQNQIINNSSFLIDYIIERNDNNSKLIITNTTTELLDVNGNSLVSFPKNLTNSTMVRLDMRTFVQPNTVTNFIVKITAFGKYDAPLNGKSFGEIEAEVPLQLNLSNSTVTTTTNSRPRPTQTSTVANNTTSATTTTTATSSTSAPSVTNSTSNSNNVNPLQILFSAMSFLGLFLI